MVTRLFGTGALGPIIVSTAILAGSAVLYARRSQHPGVAPAVEGS